MAEENAPLENAADEAKKAADAAKTGVKKAGSALAGLTGLKPANKGGAPAAKPAEAAAAETAAPESAAVPAKPVAAAPSAIKPGAGLKPVAGAGLKPVSPGAGLKPAAPGAGLKPAAPGAGIKAAAPAVGGAVAAAPKPAAAAPAKKEEAAVFTPPAGVSRREFLNYVWGASIALFTAQFGGLTFFFAFPRFRPGQFGGKIPTDVAKIPELNKPPVPNDVGKFWLVNTDEGINVLYKICTHLGCIYPWSDAAGIFACPCHGSQFKLGGEWIAGPAPRSLDTFAFEVLDAAGTVLATVSDGKPIPLPAGAATLLVNTGTKIDGASHF